ncbi:hypothetical protein DMA11_13035 [Marinilabiliaceae bacterium JC017]|nr:hypothetical protein DMA11_13035 [Marinilabiliaceae bacterium JC017]
MDEINKTYASVVTFDIGVSPGIIFFAMENFAFEMGLNLIGYQLEYKETDKNDSEKSSSLTQNVNFKLNLLSLNFGLAYYFGAKPHK